MNREQIEAKFTVRPGIFHDWERELIIDFAFACVQQAEAEQRERDAQVAEAHIGQAESERRRKRIRLTDEIQAEEHGETIAAQMIAAAIRKGDKP